MRRVLPGCEPISSRSNMNQIFMCIHQFKSFYGDEFHPCPTLMLELYLVHTEQHVWKVGQLQLWWNIVTVLGCQNMRLEKETISSSISRQSCFKIYFRCSDIPRTKLKTFHTWWFSLWVGWPLIGGQCHVWVLKTGTKFIIRILFKTSNIIEQRYSIIKNKCYNHKHFPYIQWLKQNTRMHSQIFLYFISSAENIPFALLKRWKINYLVLHQRNMMVHLRIESLLGS